MIHECNHRDTYFDTSYEDNWNDNQQEQDEYIVYVIAYENIEYSRYGCEEEAQAEVDKLSKIGVNAYY